MRILITGVSSPLGRLLATRLLAKGEHEVIGIDRRPWPDAPRGVEMHRVDIRKRPAEAVFRERRPNAMIHLATLTHFTAPTEERYRVNLQGTRQVFDYCHEYGVERAIFIGRHTIYGAAPDTPLFRTEADPPLAATTFPSLADLVAADLFAASALWRYPELATSVLRIVYTLGPSGRGTLASYLQGPRVPTVMGFDPLFQFIHESDAADAIILSLERKLRGVFNVAGPQPVPLSVLIRVTGRKALPIPEPFFDLMTGRLGLPEMPRGSRAHLKHSIVVDDRAFREATGFDPAYDEQQTMESFRWL